MKLLIVTHGPGECMLDYNDDDPPVIVSHLTAGELAERLARAQEEGYAIAFKAE